MRIIYIIIMSLCIQTQVIFSMEASNVRPDVERVDAILTIIFQEDAKAPFSLKDIAERNLFTESYDFLVYYIKNKRNFENQYKILIKKNEPLDDALKNEDLEVMRKLFQYLNLNKAEASNEQICVNYEMDLYVKFLNTLNESSAYADFEYRLYDIVAYVAINFLTNAQEHGYGGSNSADKKQVKRSNCIIS